MLKMRLLIAFAMLLICTISDIRTGYVNLRVIKAAVVLYVVAALILITLINNKYSESEFSYETISADETMNYILPVVGSLTMSAGLLALNKFKPGFLSGLGDGDVYIFAALCVIIGLRDTFYTALWAFVIAGLYALFLIIVKRKGRAAGFPFVPFMAAGFLICITEKVL